MFLRCAILATTVICAPLSGHAQDMKAGDIVRPATAPAAPKLSRSELLRRGEALFSDKRLSTNDMSCTTCHANLEGYNPSFKQPYPHAVSMTTDMLGLGPINAETMVQFCLMAPMAAKPLAWNSPDLAALTAYVLKVREEFAARK